MNDPVDRNRRRLFCGLLALPVSGIAASLTSTPTGAEGPFYPGAAMRLDDTDNDLVKITGEVEQAGGEVVWLGGRVLDSKGSPISNARVEIWQCDVNGRYLHRGESGWRSRDKAFQGFGHDLTDATGNYHFRTIKPVPYPGRTPHIHVKVLIDNQEHLTTQFYLVDHADNQSDWLYQHVSAAEREMITMRFAATKQGPRAELDIIV